ncbi:OsmC family protein [Pelagicoccus sp. SDUM812003]|uniref:OsmC family protein n=1 Tax=Pelagicoccus sp. SDUM812003 TaxID=3041267 RepID=UPI00280C4C2F|nr:OsmC family protein [Pelagicoccus sp. SDUM812003]MDQ8201517.1 OsmC family protein [Pelagicoccus sp. SDUM812003]
MSEHIATLTWERGDAAFDYKTYSRNHTWDFGHSLTVTASAAPAFLGDESKIDPEQAFVASLSSCHMLTFLAIASMRGITVERYVDRAVGHLEKNESRKPVITRVDLYPEITFADGQTPDAAALEKLHHLAHAECFLANSVKCEIVTHLPDS